MRESFSDSSKLILRLCLLLVPLFGFLISYLSSISEYVESYSFGNSTLWLIVFLVVSLIESLKNRNIKNNIYCKLNNRYLVLCVLIIIFVLFHSLFVTAGSRYVYFGIICYLTCFLAFRGVAAQSISNKSITIILWALFAIMVVVYLSSINYYITLFEGEKVFSSSYIILYSFPMLMLVSNKRMKVVCVLIVLVSLFLSNKRGAFIAGGLAIVSYFIVDYVLLKRSASKRLLSIFVVVIFSVAAYYYISKIISTTDFVIVNRLSAVSDDEGSGRTEIWADVYTGIQNSNFTDILFGHGLESVRSIAHGLTAHNDYLEVFYDFGIVTFIAYLVFIISLIKYSFYLIKKKSLSAPSFISSVFLFIVPAFFSHIIIYPQYFLLFSMFWGYVIGMDNNSLLISSLSNTSEKIK